MIKQPTASLVKKELYSLADPVKAKLLAGFFKTGKGQYGEGDVFIGITVPIQRSVAQKYRELSLLEISILLEDKIHECRLTALEILVIQYEYFKKLAQTKHATIIEICEAKKNQKRIVTFYLKHTRYINNWDLVDLSASYILGDYLLNDDRSTQSDDKTARKIIDRKILYKLVKSKNIWERRIAIISTFAFIRMMDFEDTIKISVLLLNDTHDLMHKAVGWMLREVGKRNEKVLVKFLNDHIYEMPRTMLRYAIEKFPEEMRRDYLSMRKC